MSLKKSKSSSMIRASSEFSSRYDVGGLVGKDDSVILATDKENEVVYVSRAIEKTKMPCQDMAGVEDHLHLLSGLDHVHICRFIEAFDCSGRIQLIYEKAQPVSIFDEDRSMKAGKPVSQEFAQVYCRQIAMALRVAHKQGIVHGRLNGSSLLVDEGGEDGNDHRSLKICDMGQTFILRPLRSSEQIDFDAPESLWGELSVPSSTVHFKAQLKAYQNVDMWALGVIVYRMLTGKLPFPGKTVGDKKESIKSSVVAFGKEWDAMQDAKDVVSGLLRHSGRIRTSAEKVLKHPWITLSKTRVSKSKMMRVLHNVIFNTQESTFKKFTMRVIAEDMPAEKLEIVTKAFRSIDKNGDGTLEVEEIRSVLKKYGEEEGEADEIFDAIDRDASGTLNFAEFTAVSIGPSEYCDKEALWHAFNRFDKDGNGAFDKKEIMTVVREVEHLSDIEALEKEVEEISTDIDMPVDFDTFVQIIVTPSGQKASKLSSGWNRFCYTVMKVDNHKVRHIPPKQYGASDKAMNPLLKSPYSRK